MAYSIPVLSETILAMAGASSLVVIHSTLRSSYLVLLVVRRFGVTLDNQIPTEQHQPLV